MVTKTTSRLYGQRCYLSGPMDRVDDRGVGWRRDITPFLQGLGVVVMDPTDKPINIGLEDGENMRTRRGLKERCDYDRLTESIKTIRAIDLRMVDLSDFMVAYVDTSIIMCGTWEEIFWANRLKRPILLVCKQGKQHGVPDWMFGVIPHQHMFDDFISARCYLDYVSHGPPEVIDSFSRWLFFDYKKLVVKE